MNDEIERVYRALVTLVNERYGQFEESLLTSGVLDSLKAIGFARAVEQQFVLPRGTLRLHDLASVRALADRVVACRRELTQSSAQAEESGG